MKSKSSVIVSFYLTNYVPLPKMEIQQVQQV